MSRMFELQDSDKFQKILKAINMCGFHVATRLQADSVVVISRSRKSKRIIKGGLKKDD